jgi:hypothetical protein
MNKILARRAMPWHSVPTVSHHSALRSFEKMTLTMFTQSGSANRWAVTNRPGKQIATASLGRSGLTITPVKGRKLAVTEVDSIVSFLATRGFLRHTWRRVE